MIIHVTKNHSGKMDGMQSISTACTCNPACAARAKNPACICHYCYANQFLEFRKSARERFEENGAILASRILEPDEIPRINAAVFRFEAFGDLINSTHAANYFNIARANPRTTFALWTKNPGYIAKAIIDGAKKPDNLIIIYSSPRLNDPARRAFSVYPFIDKIFTVWTPDAENRPAINCGSRNCFECQRCYSKDTEKEINEALK